MLGSFLELRDVRDMRAGAYQDPEPGRKPLTAGGIKLLAGVSSSCPEVLDLDLGVGVSVGGPAWDQVQKQIIREESFHFGSFL